MEHNDIFIVATDGLWDNLYTLKILDLMRPFVRRSDNLDDPELIAEIIANEAERFSNEPGYLSPFAKEAQRQYQDYVGGKVDDISVMIA